MIKKNEHRLSHTATNMPASYPLHHRIIECFGLEGPFRGHLVQLACNKQGHLQLDQVAQKSALFTQTNLSFPD